PHSVRSPAVSYRTSNSGSRYRALGGVRQHASYLAGTTLEAITTFFKCLVAMSTWYSSTEGLAKLAVCLLYKQLFPQRSIHLIVNITMALLIGASVGGGLADLFGCTPFSSHWGTAEEQAKDCIDTEALFVWGSFPNILTNVIMLIIPLPVIWKLHASIWMIIGLLTTFLVGSIGLITSVLCFRAFYKKSSFTDPTFNAVELIIWTVCKPSVYLFKLNTPLSGHSRLTASQMT
ncbi:putative integral membrane protein, partial [Botrytis fragariae]